VKREECEEGRLFRGKGVKREGVKREGVQKEGRDGVVLRGQGAVYSESQHELGSNQYMQGLDMSRACGGPRG